MSYVVPARPAVVVSLLDPNDEGDRPWIDKERAALARFGIRFENVPLAGEHLDPAAVLAAVERVRALPRPLMVHAFLAPSTGRSPDAEAFLASWRSGRAALSPARFAEGLARGSVEVVAPHVAMGPRPRGPEFWRLRCAGVRRVLFLGDPQNPEARADAAAAAEAPVAWQAASAGHASTLLAEEGPWYVYGGADAGLREELRAALGPALPPSGARATASSPAGPEPSAPLEQSAEPALAASAPFGLAWLEPFLPSPRQVVLLGPLFLFGAGLAAWFAGWLRTQRDVRTPYTRKIFHFSIFTSAAMLQLAGELALVVLFSSLVSCVVLYALWRGDGFPFYEALARPTDAPRRSLFIVIPLLTTAAGGVLANLLFGVFAPVGYLVGGWGDAVGEPVGTRWGRHRYSVPSLGGVPATRSLEGSTAVALASVGAALLALLALDVAPVLALGVAAACGLAAAAAEAVSHHGLDNLTVQLAGAGVAALLLG